MANARAISKFVLLASIFSIFLLLIFMLIFWFSEPGFYIHQLHVREDSINSSNPNTSIFMDLEFKRLLAITPLRYNDVNITLFYASTFASDRDFCRTVPVAVGYCIVPGFDTGRKKTVHREVVVVAARGLLWDDALRKIADGSTV
ncbi:hypothetical protein AAHA92_10875 [Salvia divinorum]|uniref:Uncharacterized protein n=1 Tax=Salvia divinorum TaxID=28513 RepID=A0ABD1HW71_SALDI